MTNSGILAVRDTECNGAEGKKENNVSSDSRTWVDLPDDLLDIISSHLNMVDFLTLGRVCRNWRLFSLAFIPWRPPLAFCISTNSTCYLYDIYSKVRYSRFPFYYSDQNNLGFSCGYLIMEDDLSSVIWAVNPITAHQLYFPPMPKPNNSNHNNSTSNPIIRRGSRSFPVPKPKNSSRCYKAILASFGPHHQDFLVVVLSYECKDLRFYNSRDNNWKTHSFTDNSWDIQDIVVFDGRVFVITNESRIGILDVGSSDLKFLKLNGAPCLSQNIRFLASNEQLLVVYFIEKLVIRVYSIDFSEREWIKVTRLGDNGALFISEKVCSRLSKTRNWGGHSNCVYYLPCQKWNNRSCKCHVISLDGGKMLEELSISKGERLGGSRWCWYFPHQSCNKIDIVNDDNFGGYVEEDSNMYPIN